MEKTKVLIVEDDAIGRKGLSRIMRGAGYRVTETSSGTEAIAEINGGSFDLVLTDLVLGDDASGIDVLSAAKKRSQNTEVVILTGYGSVDTAIAAMKKGAFHYLQKPFHAEEVRHLAAQAVEKNRLRNRVRRLEDIIREECSEPVIVGRSAKIQAILSLVRQIAPTDANVLISGESGTGKELAASMIHRYSGRAGGPFIAVNCGSFTEELLANELFGHEKDAYTGATSSRPGLLETAHGGTVFFDEVADMPLSMQAKLLRAIQQRELIRVGGNTVVAVDIRIVAATNKDLKKLIPQGLFREDLYYRLNVIPVHMPPLTERKGDIPILATFLLGRIAKRMNKAIKGFSEEAMKLLSDYEYPGNVRELENIVERAAAFCQGDLITADSLPPDIREMTVFRIAKREEGIKSMEEMEKEYIAWVLARVGHNKSKAASALQIDRTSLYRKLKKYEFGE